MPMGTAEATGFGEKSPLLFLVHSFEMFMPVFCKINIVKTTVFKLYNVK